MVCVTEIKNEIYIFVYLVFYGNACGSWGIRTPGTVTRTAV